MVKSEFMKLDIEFNTAGELMELVGAGDANLAVLEESYHTSLVVRGQEMHVSKDIDATKVEQLKSVIAELLKIIRRGTLIAERDCIYAVNLAKTGKLDLLAEVYDKPLKVISLNGGAVYAKTVNQQRYVKAIDNNDLVFGIGPAGTGKTFLAVASAVKRLKSGEVKRIILTRPAVEAGENLGFLPGDLKEKVDPYLRPLYDALFKTLGKETTEKYIESGIIEIAPLAYMRGRTLENAVVILDEAQNTTVEQMKMFLTRLGTNAKMLVNGDVSQIDLPGKVPSGLVLATSILKGVKNIGIIRFETVDVVRHPLVQKIIKAFEGR